MFWVQSSHRERRRDQNVSPRRGMFERHQVGISRPPRGVGHHARARFHRFGILGRRIGIGTDKHGGGGEAEHRACTRRRAVAYQLRTRMLTGQKQRQGLRRFAFRTLPSSRVSRCQCRCRRSARRVAHLCIRRRHVRGDRGVSAVCEVGLCGHTVRTTERRHLRIRATGTGSQHGGTSWCCATTSARRRGRVCSRCRTCCKEGLICGAGASPRVCT